MIIVKDLKLPISETEARQRVNAYFNQTGYSAIAGQSNDNVLVYKRGSRLGTILAVNPARLKCTATVQIEPRGSKNTNVRAEFNLGAVFRDETHLMDDFWKAEIENFEKAIVKGEFTPPSTRGLTGRTVAKNAVYILSGLVWVGVWGAISFLLILPAIVILRNYPNAAADSAWLVAIAIMIVAFFITRLISRYWKKRSQRQLE